MLVCCLLYLLEAEGFFSFACFASLDLLRRNQYIRSEAKLSTMIAPLRFCIIKSLNNTPIKQNKPPPLYYLILLLLLLLLLLITQHDSYSYRSCSDWPSSYVDGIFNPSKQDDDTSIDHHCYYYNIALPPCFIRKGC